MTDVPPILRRLLAEAFPNQPRLVTIFEELALALEEAKATAESAASGTVQAAPVLLTEASDAFEFGRVLTQGDGITLADAGGTLTVSTDETVPLIDGGFPVTFVVTGETSLILPEIGQLATLADLGGYVGGVIGALTAADIANVPAGGIAATDVQAALNELDTEKLAIADADERAQDAVGGILTDTTTINFTYNDATPSITADVRADSITFALMQNIASDRLIGRDTASSGDPEEITVGGGLEFTGSGGIQRSAFSGGDVTGSAGSATLTIANDAVTNAKAADMAADTIKGRANGAGTGDPTDLSQSQVLTILGGTTGTGALVRANDPTFTDDIFVTVNAIAGALIATDNVSNFLAGTTNMEISASLGRVLSINRGGSVRRDLTLDGLTVIIAMSGTTSATFDTSGLNLVSGDTYRINAVQVVKARITGWTAPTGTAQRSGFATYTAANISNPPTEAEVQAIADALQDASRTLKAVVDDLHGTAGHGLIGT